MNLKKLKQAEAAFLNSYPGGFQDPAMQAIGKRHQVEKMTVFAQDVFKKSRFSKHDVIAENMVKVVSRASMVSMFEKPKFRDFVKELGSKDIRRLSNALKEQIHGNEQKGFEAMLDILRPAKLAKWSLMTIIPNYYAPNDEVFVKPTTAKGVIAYFELDDIEYKPTPTWAFYKNYRAQILAMRKMVGPTLTPNNAAFCGFLMMTMNAQNQ